MAAGITIFLFLVFMMAVMGALSRLAPKQEKYEFVSQRNHPNGTKPLFEDKNDRTGPLDDMLDPVNPIGLIHPMSPNNPIGFTNPVSPNNPVGLIDPMSPNCVYKDQVATNLYRDTHL